MARILAIFLILINQIFDTTKSSDVISSIQEQLGRFLGRNVAQKNLCTQNCTLLFAEMISGSELEISAKWKQICEQDEVSRLMQLLNIFKEQDFNENWNVFVKSSCSFIQEARKMTYASKS